MYALARLHPALGQFYPDTFAVSQRLAQLTQQLHDLANAMTLAKQTGQVAALQQFQAQFVALHDEAASLRAQLSGSEAPSALMVGLDQFGDQALDLAKKAGKGLAATFDLLPVLLVVGIAAGLWAVGRGAGVRHL